MKILHLMMRSNLWKSFACLCLGLIPYCLAAQGIVISKDSDANPAASAILDVQSTDQGMLVPRMNKNQRDNIENLTDGLLIYQTDATPGFYYYNGSSWDALKSSGITVESDPEVGSNSVNYIPKWNGSALVKGSVYDNGNVGIGTSSPGYPLHVNGAIRSESFIQATSTLYGSYVSSSGGGNFSDQLVTISKTTSGAGLIETKGANGNGNVSITNLSGNGNHGYVVVKDASGTNQAGMYVDDNGNGYIFGDNIQSHLKNFVENHPLDPTKEIVYACVEGPEAAMYMRGTAQLINGKATISLPEHYQVLAVESSMTVLVTPLSASSRGLAVTAKSLNGIAVEELLQGTGSYAFDWEVKCVRKGYEDYQVVRDKLGVGKNISSLSGSAAAMPAAADEPEPVPVRPGPEIKQQ